MAQRLHVAYGIYIDPIVMLWYHLEGLSIHVYIHMYNCICICVCLCIYIDIMKLHGVFGQE